ncbi:MAG: FKBP-type peptidyl-prolyl cis-trans isomerase [Cyclobacteriaceae bacterium]
MKNLSVFVIVAMMVVAFSCNEIGTGGGDVSFSSLEDSVSYSYGVQIGKDILRRKVEGINPDVLATGMKDALGEDIKLTEEEMNACFQAFDAKAKEKEEERNQSMVQEGLDYLTANADKEGVTTTESGLQYKELVAGTGASPVETDQVTVHYTGKLIDGTVFDSSVERGEPATFPLNRVIPGWTEGLQLMKEGGKAELVIPSDLGYGPRGAGGDIPPNSVLIFEVELISIGGGEE